MGFNSGFKGLICNDVSLISTEDLFFIYSKEFNTLMDLLFHPANEVVVAVGACLWSNPDSKTNLTMSCFHVFPKELCSTREFHYALDCSLFRGNNVRGNSHSK